MFISTPHADTEGNMVDTVAAGIIVLVGTLIVAYFGLGPIAEGFAVVVDAVRTLYAGIVQVASSVFLGDFISGPIAEDSAVVNYIFTVREYIAGQFAFYFYAVC